MNRKKLKTACAYLRESIAEIRAADERSRELLDAFIAQSEQPSAYAAENLVSRIIPFDCDPMSNTTIADALPLEQRKALSRFVRIVPPFFF